MNALSGLILAAGFSSRMGESKPLLQWFDDTLIEFQIKLFNSLGIKPVVVLGFESDIVLSKIKNSNAEFVVNQDYKKGKSTSILKGLSCVDKNNNILLISVDQPRPKIMLDKIIKSHNDSRSLITIPKYKSKNGDLRGGHPIILDNKIIPGLSEYILKGKTMKEFIISQYDVNEIEFDDILIRLDLNIKDDYFKALKLFEKYVNNGKN
jgi:molybdenum cofactor cytidylyltransferase